MRLLGCGQHVVKRLVQLPLRPRPPFFDLYVFGYRPEVFQDDHGPVRCALVVVVLGEQVQRTELLPDADEPAFPVVHPAGKVPGPDPVQVTPLQVELLVHDCSFTG
jgi:hypothetical protein